MGVKISELSEIEQVTKETVIPVVQNDATMKMQLSALIDIIYPVGSIYISTNNIDPSNFLGGTWESFAKGKTLIGVDTDDTDFNTVEKVLGSKTVDIPKHSHDFRIAFPFYYGEILGENSTEAAGAFDYKKQKYTGFNTNFDTTDREFKANNSTSASTKMLGARTKYSQGSTSSNGEEDINVIQPSITCYMFKRVS